MRALLSGLALSLGLVASTAGAQAERSAPLPHRTLVALDPIGSVAGYYSAKVERAFRPDQTFGLGARYTEPTLRNDDDFAEDPSEVWSMDLEYRYYPRVAYRGISVGASVGLAQVRRDIREFGSGTTTQLSGSGPSFGFELGYNWLLGDAERLNIGLAAGAKRYFTTGGDKLGGDPVVSDTGRPLGFKGNSFALPAGRFSVGLVF